MKPFILLVLALTIALAQVAAADDGLSGKTAPQRVAATGTAAVNAGARRTALQPGVNVRRNSPALTQPLRHAPLAMRDQGRLGNYQARQNPDQSKQREATGAATAAFQTSNNNIRLSYFDALRRYRHERHDWIWWRQHFSTIVFVLGGYYYWDAGYWCPAWGYNPTYDSYDYDGPIYTYGNLLPDQVIVNVQSALQEEGYYSGPITGSLSSDTRAALANYQRDYGLAVTAAVDESTIESLGLN